MSSGHKWKTFVPKNLSLRLSVTYQSTGLVRHVFRLLETALRGNHGVPWVLLENVRRLLRIQC